MQFQSLPIAIYGTKEENGNQFFPDIDIFPLKVSLTQERKGQLEELYELK